MNRRVAFACFAMSLLAGVIFLGGCGGGSSVSTGYGSIRGVVYDQPVETRGESNDALIAVGIDGAALSVSVPDGNQFLIERVPAGLHTLVARKEGRSGVVVVEVREGEETNVGEIVLGPAGKISGLVYSAATQEPLKGVLVTVSSLVQQAEEGLPHPVWTRYTDADGSYDVAGLPEGEYIVTYAREGFRSVSCVIYVAALQTTPQDIALTPISGTGLGSIAGTVTSANDAGDVFPVAGAMVMLLPVGVEPTDPPLPPISYRNGVRVGDAPSSDADIPPSPPDLEQYYTFTDAHGKYELTGVPAGEYLAIASRPGFEADHRTVVIKPDRVSQVDFALALPKSVCCTIEGKVTDSSTGLPIAGASVWAVIGCLSWPCEGGGDSPPSPPVGGYIAPDPVGTRMWTETDEQGNYALSVPPDVIGIAVSAEGYADAFVSISVTPGVPANVNIALDPMNRSLTLSGVVWKPDGVRSVPAAGATVCASRHHGDGDIVQPAVVVTATCDSSGHYTMELQAGAWSVYAQSGGLRSRTDVVELREDTVHDIFLGISGESPPPLPPPLPD